MVVHLVLMKPRSAHRKGGKKTNAYKIHFTISVAQDDFVSS